MLGRVLLSRPSRHGGLNDRAVPICAGGLIVSARANACPRRADGESRFGGRHPTPRRKVARSRNWNRRPYLSFDKP
jgi:hypothetical protein